MGRSCIGWNQPGRHRWRARARRTASCSTAGPVRQHSAGHFNAGHPRRNSNHPADALTFRDGHTDANPDSHCYADADSYADSDDHCYADADSHADSDDHCNADSDWHLHAIAVDQCPGNQYRPADADHGPGGTISSIGHRPAAGSG